MPRKPRIDAPGLLYHVIQRGIERRSIFEDDKDKAFFLERLGEILTETKTPIYAFCLMPNHLHLLLRRGETPISTVMRRLLTGYAVNYNKRRKRTGYLFQGRYKAILCQDDPYLLELIRYIHLNPVRMGLLPSPGDLLSDPLTGHGYVLEKHKAVWFHPEEVLSHFGSAKRRAQDAYVAFVDDGVSMGKREDLLGGGLRRSLGFPKIYPKIKQAYDDRILGEGSFVEQVLSFVDDDNGTKRRPDLESVAKHISDEYDVDEAELFGASRRRDLAAARAALAYAMSREMGLTGSDIARKLHVTRSGVAKMIQKGQRLAENNSNGN